MITPVILCGGSGTRLWPVSRKSFPKQFVPLAAQGTLFQAAASRMLGAVDVASPLVITNSDFRFIVAEQLDQIQIDPADRAHRLDGSPTYLTRSAGRLARMLHAMG